MNRSGQSYCRFSALVLAAASLISIAIAQPLTNNLVIMPPVAQPHSPVDIFRQLLVLSPRDREQYLTNKTPEVLARLLAKVREYQALDPDERELRLRATELRWYLLPLLHTAPANRLAGLPNVPEQMRGLISSRLGQWDALPPAFQKEFLENERTLRYFTHLDATNPAVPGWHLEPDTADKARWDALSDAEQQKISDQFNQFFELTPDEKQKTLGTLSSAERTQMEKTLQTFSTLPPSQRAQCIRAFTEFTRMSSGDRAQFLKNAERWSQMSPKERQAWRDLVAQVPMWPPIQPNLKVLMPPMPKVPPHNRSQVATN